jgi:hypothetical protein
MIYSEPCQNVKLYTTVSEYGFRKRVSTSSNRKTLPFTLFWGGRPTYVLQGASRLIKVSVRDTFAAMYTGF